MEAHKYTIRPYRQGLLPSSRRWNANQNIQDAGLPRPVGRAGPLAVELRQCARYYTRDYGCQTRCLTLTYRQRDFANMHAHPVRKNCTNPAFSLPARRPKSRSKRPPPSPSRAHPTTHVLRRAGLRPHHGTKSRGKQKASRLRMITLADIKEDAHVEGQVSEDVPEDVAPQDCNILRASDTNQQRASADSLKQSTIKNIEPGLMDPREIRVDKVR